MRKTLKRLLAQILTVTLFLGALPNYNSYAMTISAATEAELLAAISSASDGDTINITADIQITDQVGITKALTFNGGAHTISVPTTGMDEAGMLNASPSNFRVFNCDASGKTIQISNIKIKGGRPSDGGGGIRNAANTTLALDYVTISNSGGYTDSFRPGGGIHNSGTIYLNNCNISRNGSRYAGGAYNEDTGIMFIENTLFSDNRSLDSGGGGGGCENKGSLYINNSTFANNISTEMGSAINNVGNGTACVLNTTISGNVCYNSEKDSGAIRTQKEAHFVNCAIVYNYMTTNGGDTYVLRDFSGTETVGTSLYYSSYHQTAALPEGVTLVTNTDRYTGAIDGADNTISAGGSSSKLLTANGLQLGGATVYQPFLVLANATKQKVVALKSGSYCYGKATATAFKTGSSPTIAYKSGGAWQYIVGAANGDAESNQVTTDQVGLTKTPGESDAIGSTVYNTSNLVIMKIKASSGGSVTGASIYGDVFPAGTSITITAHPDTGRGFIQWNNTSNVLVSTNNPYTFILNTNTELTPTWSTVPYAPTSVAANSRRRAALVRFTAPASDGGSDITGYTIKVYKSGVLQGETAATQVSGTMVYGLTNGASYTFKVYATNSVGNSSDSAESSPVIPRIPQEDTVAVAQPAIPVAVDPEPETTPTPTPTPIPEYALVSNSGTKISGISLTINKLDTSGTYMYSGVEIGVFKESANGEYEVLPYRLAKIVTNKLTFHTNINDVENYVENKKYKIGYRIIYNLSAGCLNFLGINSNEIKTDWKFVKRDGQEVWFTKKNINAE